MLVSERILKWAMRLYPPLLFQRIWVIKFDTGFRGVRVKINRSLINKNFNNSIFGGTIFSAADPLYPLLFHQLLNRKGYHMVTWSKSSAIQYHKPAITDLYFNINISDDEIAECEHILNTVGKYLKAYTINIYDKKGEVCVSIVNEVYVRNLDYKYIGEEMMK